MKTKEEVLDELREEVINKKKSDLGSRFFGLLVRWIAISGIGLFVLAIVGAGLWGVGNPIFGLSFLFILFTWLLVWLLIFKRIGRMRTKYVEKKLRSLNIEDIVENEVPRLVNTRTAELGNEIHKIDLELAEKKELLETMQAIQRENLELFLT